MESCLPVHFCYSGRMTATSDCHGIELNLSQTYIAVLVQISVSFAFYLICGGFSSVNHIIRPKDSHCKVLEEVREG